MSIEKYISNVRTNFVLLPCDTKGYDSDLVSHLAVEIDRALFLSWQISVIPASNKKQFFETNFWYNNMVPIYLEEEDIKDYNINDKTYLDINSLDDLKEYQSDVMLECCIASIGATCIDFRCDNKYAITIEYFTDIYKIEDL